MIELLATIVKNNLTNKKNLTVAVQPFDEETGKWGDLFRSGKLDVFKLSDEKSMCQTEQFFLDATKVDWEFWKPEGRKCFLYSKLINFDEMGAKFAPYGQKPIPVTGQRRIKLVAEQRDNVYELEFQGKMIDIVLYLDDGKVPEEWIYPVTEETN